MFVFLSKNLGLFPEELIPGKDATGDQQSRQNQAYNQKHALSFREVSHSLEKNDSCKTWGVCFRSFKVLGSYDQLSASLPGAFSVAARGLKLFDRSRKRSDTISVPGRFVLPGSSDRQSFSPTRIRWQLHECCLLYREP